MDGLKVYYRISDKGNPKEKIPNADKFTCLDNAIKEFGADNINVIADNCNSETLDFIASNGLKFEETSFGNSGSFIYMVNKIISDHDSEIPVYLLEDDYIHLPGSRKAILEGLAIADYVTLYDHPDKYFTEDKGGSPMNFRSLRLTRLYATESSHWRETDSTTMTFACKVSTLEADLNIWKRYCVHRNPDDYHAFMEITPTTLSDLFSFIVRLRKRESLLLVKKLLSRRRTHTLISAVPAKATHAEVRWLAPVIDWK